MSRVSEIYMDENDSTREDSWRAEFGHPGIDLDVFYNCVRSCGSKRVVTKSLLIDMLWYERQRKWTQESIM